MKRLGYIALIFLVLAFLAGAASAIEITCFNELFQRKIGQPRQESHTFNALAGPATVRVYNGDGGHWLARGVLAKVDINEQTVFQSRDFNKRVAFLEAQLDLLEGENEIDVTLLGIPGVKFRVEIVQEVEESEIILSGQDKAIQICKDKIDQLGDTEEARIEAVALIKSLPGVNDSGISEDGTIWIKYEGGIEGLILLNPEGSLGGGTITQEINNSNILTSSAPSESDVLIWDPFKFAPVDDLKEIFNNSECHNFVETKYLKEEECSIESVKDDFTKYGTIIIFSHGVLDSEGNEIFTTGKKLTKEELKKKIEEFDLEAIGIRVSNFFPWDGPLYGKETYLGITPTFISKISGTFKDAILFNGSCNSLKKGKMSSAFKSKGIKIYYGLTTYGKADIVGQAARSLFENLVENQETAVDAFYAVPEIWRCPLGFSCLGIDANEIGDLDFKYSCNNPGLITIDGDPSDWNGIEPIITDASGNAPNDYADFRKLFITHDDKNIYFLAEFADDLEVTKYPDSPFDLGIDYADLNIDLDTDIDNTNHCDGIEFGLNITNMWHPAFNDYGWLGDMRDCAGTSADFPGAVSTAIKGRYIESSVSRADLETLTPNMSGFDLKLSAPSPINIARYWLNGTGKPGPVFVDPTGGLWDSQPQIIKVSSSNADRIYCTLRTTTDGSIPPDPPEPTKESHDPFDVGVDYISGSSGDFVFWETNNGIKNLKVRFRAYNKNGYGPTSDVYFYRIDFPPTIAQWPMSGPPGTTFVQWGTGFTPNSAARLHFRKPDGSEYPPEYVNLDEIGHFEIEYTAPLNKPAGKYTWWAIDLSTNETSNPVSYWIE